MERDEISNAYFNIVDVENTLDGTTKALPRVHGGTENDTTVGELLHDIKIFIEELEAECDNKTS